MSFVKKWNADNADFQALIKLIKSVKICVAMHLRNQRSINNKV